MEVSRVSINNNQLAYTDTGVGRPIVLIHGYPFNRSLWTEQIPSLSNSHRIIAPDLRGFGDSDAFSRDEHDESARRGRRGIDGPSRDTAPPRLAACR
jgi:pimeloyl-ACP methyl ester carboxylesterase